MAENQICITYGNAKTGKTTDLGFTFPTGVFFAPSASSVFPLKKMAGLKPKTAIVKSLIPVYKYIVKHAQDESITAIVIDDIALLADAAVKEWKDGAGSNGWLAYAEIKRVCQEICIIARHSPWHLVLDSHERAPETTETGYFIRGGPMLPGKQAGPELQKNASIIIRAAVGSAIDDTSGATEAWAGVYLCDQSDPNWVTGDRNGFALRSNPMNLREILHAGGVELPRIVDWQEDYVEKLSEVLLKGDSPLEVTQKCIAAMEKRGAHDTLVNWTLRDAYDRAFFKRHKNNRRDLLMKNFGAA
jgi:hypothetical protein